MRPYRAELELCAPMGDAPASMPGGVGALTVQGNQDGDLVFIFRSLGAFLAT